MSTVKCKPCLNITTKHVRSNSLDLNVTVESYIGEKTLIHIRPAGPACSRYCSPADVVMAISITPVFLDAMVM